MAHNGFNDIIRFDDSYKETGDKVQHKKDGSTTRTCADYILAIKDTESKEHFFSFQAKLGKPDKTKKNLGNIYSEINHQIGGNGPFQIDEYDEFLKQNNASTSKTPNIEGFYIFYNGAFKGTSNDSDTAKLKKLSFWILNENTVKNLMGVDHKILSISDVCSKHVEFIGFLRRFS